MCQRISIKRVRPKHFITTKVVAAAEKLKNRFEFLFRVTDLTLTFCSAQNSFSDFFFWKRRSLRSFFVLFFFFWKKIKASVPLNSKNFPLKFSTKDKHSIRFTLWLNSLLRSSLFSKDVWNYEWSKAQMRWEGWGGVNVEKTKRYVMFSRRKP